MWNYITNSTLKREAASLPMAWLLVMATFIIVKAQTFEQQLQVLTVFALPLIAVFTAAFGADYLAKQTNIGGPPSSKSHDGSTDPAVDVPAVDPPVPDPVIVETVDLKQTTVTPLVEK